MDLKRIKRLHDLRDFVNVNSPSIDHNILKEKCEDKDSEQFSKDFEKINKEVLAFREKYPEIYSDDWWRRKDG